MKNELQRYTTENLIARIQVHANRLDVLKRRSESRDLTDEELNDYEMNQRDLSKASDALRIKFN